MSKYNKTISEVYKQYIEEQKISPDQEQKALIALLSNLEKEITKSKQTDFKTIVTSLLPAKKKIRKQGIYIYGEVGRGKSMIMDMFFDTVPEEKKKRIHFHEFMIDIHSRLRQQRKKEKKSDPLIIVAKEISKEVKLLCFDEFNVTDITDAMILGRLFQALFKYGLILVTTSNCKPENLYKEGLQRERFLPFIELLKESLVISELIAKCDYRMTYLKSLNKTYFTPYNKSTLKSIKECFEKLTNYADSEETLLKNQGKEIKLEKTHGNICWTSFENLCCKPLGTNDYIKICNNFEVIILENIPKMNKDSHNEAKRFTNLIDIIYENKVKLICNAATDPSELYTEGKGSFEFQRTVSRLIEMQSDSYLKLEHKLNIISD